MSPRLCSKIGSRIGRSHAAILIVASFAVSLGAQNAIAAAAKHPAAHARNAHAVHRSHVSHHLARASSAPVYGYADGRTQHPIQQPGYVFVPGRGILGESCNMPTSTCTNEYRDVQ
jgi:hypothetical protein